MKTSRIIFISYFSIIGLFLISLMIMGFAFKNKNHGNFNPENIKHETISLDSFTHIQASENCRITIKSATNNELIYTSFDNKEIVKPTYRIENDTLFVAATQTNMNNNIELHVKYILTIIGNNCNYTLRSFTQNELNIDMKKSNVTFYEQSSIGSLKMSLNNQSKCSGNNFNIANLILQSHNSRFDARIQNKLESVEGIITDNSDVRLPAALKYNLDVDKSSTIKMY